MRWLDPDWSIVRFVKSVIYEEDDEHHPYHHQNQQKANSYQDLDGFDTFGGQLDIPEMEI